MQLIRSEIKFPLQYVFIMIKNQGHSFSKRPKTPKISNISMIMEGL